MRRQWVANYLLVLLVVGVTAGCSVDTAKRVTYETLENMHERACMQNQSVNCAERTTYDDYQHQRDELDLKK